MLFPFSLTIDHGLSDMSNPEFLTIRAKTEATLLDPAQTWIREHDADSEKRELALYSMYNHDRYIMINLLFQDFLVENRGQPITTCH